MSKTTKIITLLLCLVILAGIIFYTKESKIGPVIWICIILVIPLFYKIFRGINKEKESAKSNENPYKKE